MPQEIINKVYKPSMNVGQVYARPYGSSAAMMPVGNVLELQLAHTEDVQRQTDMTQQGGGIHAEVRRVTEVNVSMRLADVNVVNLARATQGTVSGIEAGTVVNEPHAVTLGGLIALEHIDPTAVTLRQGEITPVVVEDEAHAAVDRGQLVPLANAGPYTAVTVKVGATLGTAPTVAAAGNYTVTTTGIQVDAAAPDIPDDSNIWVTYTYQSGGVVVPQAGNWLVRPEGIFLLDGAVDLTNGNPLYVSYTYGAYAAIEALTTRAAELELLFGGLNEADSGKPVPVNIWRCSQGVTSSLALLGSSFGSLQVSGSVLQDPTKTGTGVSKYYRARVK